MLGKHHKLFTDKVELGGDKDNPLIAKIERVVIDNAKDTNS